MMGEKIQVQKPNTKLKIIFALFLLFTFIVVIIVAVLSFLINYNYFSESKQNVEKKICTSKNCIKAGKAFK